jgi:hypothetical protein
MNARDQELANQVTWYADVTLTELSRYADLIRADERARLEKIDWTALMREGYLVTWADAQELGDRVLAAIRARGNT